VAEARRTALAWRPLKPPWSCSVHAVGFVDLLYTPQDIPFLSGLIEREIIYRVLRSCGGGTLRAIATLGDQSHRTQRRSPGSGPTMRPAARGRPRGNRGMGVSTLHHHFRVLTALSPLQYQKQVRLQAAAYAHADGCLDAASARLRSV